MVHEVPDRTGTVLRTALLLAGVAVVAAGFSAVTIPYLWVPRIGVALLGIALAVPATADPPVVPTLEVSPDHRRYLLAGAVLIVPSMRTLTVAALVAWGVVLLDRLHAGRVVVERVVETVTDVVPSERLRWVDGAVEATRTLAGGIGLLSMLGSVVLAVWLGSALGSDPSFTPEGFLAVLAGFLVFGLVFVVGLGLAIVAAAAPGPGRLLLAGHPAAERRLTLAGAVLLVVGPPLDLLLHLAANGSSFLLLGLVLVTVGPLMRAGTRVHRMGRGTNPQT